MYSNVYLLEYFNKHFATRGCLLFSNVYDSVNSAISFPILFSSANCTPLQLAETRPIDYTCMHIFIWVPAHILAEERSSKSLRRSWVTKVTGVTRWRRTRIKRAQAAVGSTSSAARHCSVTSWAKAPVPERSRSCLLSVTVCILQAWASTFCFSHCARLLGRLFARECVHWMFARLVTLLPGSIYLKYKANAARWPPSLPDPLISTSIKFYSYLFWSFKNYNIIQLFCIKSEGTMTSNYRFLICIGTFLCILAKARAQNTRMRIQYRIFCVPITPYFKCLPACNVWVDV